MKTLLLLVSILVVSSFADAKPALIPNVICDYGKVGNDWYMMGASIDFDEMASGVVVLKNVSTTETYGPLAGPQSGICATMPILTNSNKYILKLAAYSAAEEFSMEEDTCEFHPEGLAHQTWAHFKIDVIAGQATRTGTDILQMINYFLLPSEIKAWSQDAGAAQDSADQKCLELFPGSKPAP